MPVHLVINSFETEHLDIIEMFSYTEGLPEDSIISFLLTIKVMSVHP